MKTNVKNILLAIGVIAVSYTAGAFFGFPESNGNYSKGDISKVNKYHKTNLAPVSSAFLEKLQNDSVALKNEFITKELFSSRIEVFSSLVEKSVAVADSIPEMREEIEALKETKKLSENAIQVAKTASSSYDEFTSGKETNYEQASKDLTLAYLMVDNKVTLGKNFVIKLDDYLSQNTTEDNSELVKLRDNWAAYCASSAILSGDKAEKQYWTGKNCKSSDKTSVNVSKLAYTALSFQLDETLNNKFQEKLGQNAIGQIYMPTDLDMTDVITPDDDTNTTGDKDLPDTQDVEDKIPEELNAIHRIIGEKIETAINAVVIIR